MTGPLDPAAVVARLGGDEALARMAATIFLDEAPRLLARVREAIAAGDAAALAATAHTLKSAAGNFPAPAAVEAAHRLEERGHRGELENAAADYAALDEALSALSLVLATLVRGRSR